MTTELLDTEISGMAGCVMQGEQPKMPPLLYPERSAAETIRGYMTQVQWSTLRWLALSDNEVLLCEGDEDIDKYLFDTSGNLQEITQEQFKDLADRISARTPAVYETVFNFIRSFYEHHTEGRQCKFVFTTSASVAKQRITKASSKSSGEKSVDLAIDVLQDWMGLEHDTSDSKLPGLQRAIRALVEHYLLPNPEGTAARELSAAVKKHATIVRQAVAYLDQDNARWASFLHSVVWNFDNPTSASVKAELTQAIKADPRLQGLPAELVAERLIVAVFETSSHSKSSNRVLTKAQLVAIVQTTESELKTWAARVHPESLSQWMSLVDERVAEHERRIATLEYAASPQGQRTAILADNLSKLRNPQTYERHIERAWMYFRPRVIKGLFVAPRDFDRNLALFARRADVIARIMDDLQQLCMDIRKSLGLAGHDIPHENSRDQLSRAVAQMVEAMENLIKAQAASDLAESTIRSLMGRIESLIEETKGNINDIARSEEGKAARILPPLLGRLQRLLRAARRFVATGWILSSPAGRGKSNFLWEAADRLASDSEAICLLTGRDLDGSASIEQTICRELGLTWHDHETFENLVQAYHESTGRPIFVLIDAVNEARADLTLVANQLAAFMVRYNNASGLHLLVSCRDLFWSTAFVPALGGLLDFVVIDTEDNVAPELTNVALMCYFRHFDVRNVHPQDLHEWEWVENPLFVRVFCETYSSMEYAGPKPIKLHSFDLIQGYFRRKQEELYQRGFPVISLLDSLTDLASDMIRTGRNLSSQPSAPRFAVAESVARRVLSSSSRSNELLFDALIDMDLVLQFDLDQSVRRYAGFTFERFQDFFVARAVLRDVEDGKLTLDDTLPHTLSHSSALSDAALGTLIAMAIEYGFVKSFHDLTALGLRALPSILDLVSPDVLKNFEDELDRLARTGEGVHSLISYAGGQLQAQRSARRSFVETFGLSLLAKVVLSFSLYDRHLYFYSQSAFSDSFADLVEVEIGEMRDWVRRGFERFPGDVDASIQRVKAVILLLGSNSPHVRDLAHEWVFWVGRFKPNEVCQCLLEFVDEADLFIRERTLALVYALLKRRPELRSAAIANEVFRTVLDKHSVTYTPHYFIVEFGRKILLEFGGNIKEELTVDQWESVQNPPRHRSEKGAWEGATPEWTDRGPIRGDQSRYTFGSRFRLFPLDRDQAVQEALALLPSLGYDSSQYEVLDHRVAELHPGARIWGQSSGRRYERFGKSYAHLASWIVLGKWAETKPISADVVDPAKPFALDQPEYDYLFNVSVMDYPQENWPAFDFPEDMSVDDWELHDEHQYLKKFVEQFPGEVVVWASVDRTKSGRRLSGLVRGALLLPEYAQAYRWAGTWREASRNEYFGHLNEEYLDEAFEFHNLREAAVDLPELSAELPAIAVTSNYVRTMNDEDYSILTISPRLIQAANLVQLETEGEFADQSGQRVVRLVKWGRYGDSYCGRIVLVQEDVLGRCIEKLNLTFAQFYFTRLVSVDEAGRYDSGVNIARWGINIRGLEEQSFPGTIGDLLRLWERSNYALSSEQLVVLMHLAQTQGEESVRSYLSEVEAKRKEVPDFFLTVPDAFLKSLRKKLRDRQRAEKKARKKPWRNQKRSGLHKSARKKPWRRGPKKRT